jgi:hypothetical protein
VIQALATDRADDPFTIRILPGWLRGNGNSSTAADDASVTTLTDEPTSWAPGTKLLVTVERADGSTEAASLRVGQVLTVGKAAACDLVITGDDSLADKQFLISCNENVATLFDFGSGIAALVNGSQVEQHGLCHGDPITAGRTLIRVQMP